MNWPRDWRNPSRADRLSRNSVSAWQEWRWRASDWRIRLRRQDMPSTDSRVLPIATVIAAFVIRAAFVDALQLETAPSRHSAIWAFAWEPAFSQLRSMIP